MLFLCLLNIQNTNSWRKALKHVNSNLIQVFIVNMIKTQGTTKKEHGLKGLPTYFDLQSSTEIHAQILESWE